MSHVTPAYPETSGARVRALKLTAGWGGGTQTLARVPEGGEDHMEVGPTLCFWAKGVVGWWGGSKMLPKVKCRLMGSCSNLGLCSSCPLPPHALVQPPSPLSPAPPHSSATASSYIIPWLKWPLSGEGRGGDL